MKHILAITLLVLPILGCQPLQEGDASLHSDSGITPPSYQVMQSKWQDLVGQNSAIASYVRYGKTVASRDLTLIRINRRGVQGVHSRDAILIGGVIHGDEYLNIADRLPAWFIAEQDRDPDLQRYFSEGGAIYIAPVLNPDGMEARRRENNNGQDLNRDFDHQPLQVKNFKQPETASLRQYVTRIIRQRDQRHLRISMDYHCCMNTVLYPWSHGQGASIPQADLNIFREAGNDMRAVFGSSFRFGNLPQLGNYEAIGTSKDYYYAYHRTLAFTFEGLKAREKDRFAQHQQMWRQLVRRLNTGRLLSPVEELFVYIASTASTNRLQLVVSASNSIDSVSVSANGQPINLSNGQTLGQRRVFLLEDMIDPSDALELLGKDASGRTIVSRTVQIRARQTIN